MRIPTMERALSVFCGITRLETPMARWTISRFSPIVFLRMRAGSCHTCPIRRRYNGRRHCGIRLICCPSTHMAPSSGVMWFASRRRSVVFPAPLLPIRKTKSPASIESESSSIAAKRRFSFIKYLLTWSNSIWGTRCSSGKIQNGGQEWTKTGLSAMISKTG